MAPCRRAAGSSGTPSWWNRELLPSRGILSSSVLAAHPSASVWSLHAAASALHTSDAHQRCPAADKPTQRVPEAGIARRGQGQGQSWRRPPARHWAQPLGQQQGQGGGA